VVKKKARELDDFKTTFPQQPPQNTVLEVDEIFTFVGKKKNEVRIWIVLNRLTRQIVSYFIGDGSSASCMKLWQHLPEAYYNCRSFSDLWRSYNCLPVTTHSKTRKGSGKTSHVERFNNTLRQTFSRLVRKALSFSKKLYMLHLHFKLWAYIYNIKLIN